MWAR
ncbi:hypothetical protein EK904_001247 [Melospiza melodia maxima]|jgi:hypothetical protein